MQIFFFCLSSSIYMYFTLDPVCLPVTSQLAPGHWTKVEWWKWPCAGVGWDSANTKVTRLLCNHQASTHVSGLCVSQYMRQMAGRVLNKHKYMLVIISGYRQLLVPLYTLPLFCPRRVEKENLKSPYLGLHCFKDQKCNYVQLQNMQCTSKCEHEMKHIMAQCFCSW